MKEYIAIFTSYLLCFSLIFVLEEPEFKSKERKKTFFYPFEVKNENYKEFFLIFSTFKNSRKTGGFILVPKKFADEIL